MPQSAQLAQVQVAVKPQSPPPMLGPALGLYAKDPEKKYLLLADFRGCGNLIRPRPLCLLAGGMALCAALFLSACDKMTLAQLPDAVISYEQNGSCYVPCAAYTLTIRTNDESEITVRESKKDTPKIQQCRLPKGTSRSILETMDKVNFLSLKDIYETSRIPSHGSWAIGVTASTVRKSVEYVSGAEPKGFIEIAREIIEKAGIDPATGTQNCVAVRS